MYDRTIIIYAQAPTADPKGAKLWGLLGLTLITLLLASWGLNWIWREAEAVTADPLNAPVYTLTVLAVFLLTNGLLAWSTWRTFRRLLIFVRALFLGLVDLVDAIMFAVRQRMSRLWK